MLLRFPDTTTSFIYDDDTDGYSRVEPEGLTRSPSAALASESTLELWRAAYPTLPRTLLGEPGDRPGIAGTAYDTAWLAGVPADSNPRRSRFPTALQWLVGHQLSDGSWGGSVRYEHDRVLCTLAALGSLASLGSRTSDRVSVAAGTRYLWQHRHLLAGEPAELVGFELLLPSLVERAERAGVSVPPHLDIYGPKRAEKLALIPPEFLYSPQATMVHSLEFLGDQADVERMRRAQASNGSIGNSPAATAFFYARARDERALGYLQSSLAAAGGATAPVLEPCETFELLWAAYHLYLAGVPADRLLNPDERVKLLGALQTGGVSLSPSFPIPDADDTAVALLLLHELGAPVDPNVLAGFGTSAGHFASFPHERHSSVGVNLHALHALSSVRGYADWPLVSQRLLDYVCDEQIDGLYWIDKWHISPYYATAHAVCVGNDLPEAEAARLRPAVERSLEWLRQTQNEDGSWGFYGSPTAEETAYGLLALATETRSRPDDGDRQRCVAAARYLETAVDMTERGANQEFPPLWIDKCLYTPTLIVWSAIKAARMAYLRIEE